MIICSIRIIRPQLKAVSVAFGIFMGIVPIWGFQLVVAIFLAILFKLNKAVGDYCSQYQHTTYDTAHYFFKL